MEAIAKAKYIKGSPRKARLVIDMIRGVNVAKALAILNFTNKRATDPIATCLKSAIANATFKAEQENIAVDPDDLWVKTCFVDMGPTKGRRRMRPAPQGRAYKEQRHYCHITIAVTSEKPEVKVFKKPTKAVVEPIAEVKATVKNAVTTEKTVAETTEATEKE
jgi:large subunit ribosomal protein L22